MTETTSNTGEARRAAVRKFLGSCGLRDFRLMDSAALGAAQQLFSDRLQYQGFGVLWSLIAFDRAQDQSELSRINLGTPQGVARASVLQGQIRAVDRLYELLLDIADPTVQGQEQENAQ